MDENNLVKALSERPDLAPYIADQLDLAGMARLAAFRRQREHAAARRLKRARAQKAGKETIERLTWRHARFKKLASQAAEMFVAANVPRPLPIAGRSTIVVEIKTSGKPNKLRVALVRDGKVLSHSKFDKRGEALLRADGDLVKVRVQVSEGDAVVFRDTESFSVYAGQLAYREVSLANEEVKSPPPSTDVKMPGLEGQSREVGVLLLRRLGIRKVHIDTRQAQGPVNVILDQSPDAGSVLKDSTSIKLTVSEAKRLPKGKDTKYDRFIAAAESDKRWKKLSVADGSVRAVLERGKTKSVATVAKVIELDNEKIMKRFGLQNLREAITFRSILSHAADAVG